MKTRFWIPGMIVIFSLLFVGCNGDGDGDGSTPPPPPAPGAGPGGGDGDGDGDGGIDVTGTWTGSFNLPPPQGYTFVLVQTNGTVTGTGTTSGNVTRSYGGTLTNSHLVLTSLAIVFDLTVSGDTMVGTYTDSSFTDRPASFTR